MRRVDQARIQLNNRHHNQEAGRWRTNNHHPIDRLTPRSKSWIRRTNRWIASQGIDIVRGFSRTYTRPRSNGRDRIGGNGVCIMLDGAGSGTTSSSASRGEEPQFAAPYLRGAGLCAHRRPRRDDGVAGQWRRADFWDWQTGSYFALPLNAWYQHFNGQGDQEDPAVVGDHGAARRFVPQRRFRHQLSLLVHRAVQGRRRFLHRRRSGSATGWSEPDFVADVVNIEPVEWSERGKGNATIFFEMYREH